MTRLLNTAIIGRCENAVVSSRIDMLAGLSGLNIRRMPPAFWAWTADGAVSTARTITDTINRRSFGVMLRLLRYRFAVESRETGPSSSMRVQFSSRLQTELW